MIQPGGFHRRDRERMKVFKFANEREKTKEGVRRGEKVVGSILLDGAKSTTTFHCRRRKGNITQLSSVFLIISHYTETTKREREREREREGNRDAIF